MWYRQMEVKDLQRCRDLLAGMSFFTAAELQEIQAFWKCLLTSERVRAAVVETKVGDQEVVLGFGASVCVQPKFMAALQQGIEPAPSTNRPPSLVRRLMCLEQIGCSPILSTREIGRVAQTGCHVVGIGSAVATDLSPEQLGQVMLGMRDSLQDFHSDLVLQSIAKEVYAADLYQRHLAYGLDCWQTLADGSNGPSAWLMGITRERALLPGREAFLVHVLFETTPPPLTLTDRQRWILKLACDGLDNKQIAATLMITEKTVRKHFEITYAAIREQAPELLPKETEASANSGRRGPSKREFLIRKLSRQMRSSRRVDLPSEVAA